MSTLTLPIPTFENKVKQRCLMVILLQGTYKIKDVEEVSRRMRSRGSNLMSPLLHLILAILILLLARNAANHIGQFVRESNALAFPSNYCNISTCNTFGGFVRKVAIVVKLFIRFLW